ncbi:hypothetical protein [Desnuesiella massiliensis]|uniref:hypothetical protein n=1 Tax=Desnuesiella massiliensis TaxID=1650662 RepID=UPI0006E44F18|nr:hypothetical protein [Desnuesiella massiliensis]
MINISSRYYKESGKIPPFAPLIIILIGILAVPILSFIYSYATFYIPFIYANLFIAIAFGILIGIVVSFAGKLGKVRNKALLIIFALLFAILAEYFAWVAWIYAYSKQTAFIWHPLDVLEVMKLILPEGTWSIGRSHAPVRGTFLALVWIIEAIIILVSSIIFPSMTSVFCEECNCWIKDEKTLSHLEPIENVEEFKNQLEQRQYSALLNLQKVDEGSAVYTEVDFGICDKCKNLSYMTVKTITVKKDSKGKEKKSEEDIVEKLIIDTDTYRSLEALIK